MTDRPTPPKPPRVGDSPASSTSDPAWARRVEEAADLRQQPEAPAGPVEPAEVVPLPHDAPYGWTPGPGPGTGLGTGSGPTAPGPQPPPLLPTDGSAARKPEPLPPPPRSDDAIAALARVSAALRRRAWQVHGGTALLAFVGTAGLVALLAAVALGAGATPLVRPIALGLLALAATAAAIFAWRRAGQPTDIELARLLESRDPRAAGLTTAVELAGLLPLAERDDLIDKPFSAELARAHVEATARTVRQAGPREAFDDRPLRWSGAAAALSLALLAVAAFLAEAVTPGLGRLAFGDAPAENDGELPRAAPITGDIALTYLYPAHTGLPPKTVEGTNGEITAPIGTQVRIETRADRDLARAYVDVDGASLPMEVKGRQLTGTLLVQKSGAYRFRFADDRNRNLAVGPEIPITAALDGAPTIDILAPVAELTVTERDPVQLQFEAADDYGVAKVELVYQVGGTPEQQVSVSSYGTPRRRADGSWVWELATLKLRPGDVVTYYLRATDNDAVGGAKQGQSRTQTLKVFSEAEHLRELIAKVEEAWEGMVLALGDRIAPREGPRAVRGEKRIDAGAPADEQVLQVGTTLSDVAGELRKDEKAPQELSAALINISQGVLEKGRFTRSARARARTAPGAQLAALDRAEAAEQQELERSVLYLEALLDRQRIQQIEELAREMAGSRRELANLMEQYREAPSDAAKQEILRELARLKDRMNELMRRMAELSKGIQDEHLNAEAMKAMAEERNLASGLDEIEKLLGEGKIDEAMAKLQELGMQMDEMAQALSDAADSQAENDPALAELQKDLQQYEEQLQQLQQDQAELADATEQLKREQAKKLEEQLAQNGEKLIDELKAKVERAQDRLAEVPSADVPPRLTEDLGGAQERLQDLENALSVKDFDAAMESAAQALAHTESLERTLERELGYARQFNLPDRDAIEEARQPAAAATPLVREVKQKLEEMFANPARQMSPEQRQQMERMAQRQGELEEQMRQLQQQAQKIGQQAPIFDESAQGAMQGAQQSMSEAGQKLRGRNPGGALASERQAQEQLQSLQQGLEKAKQQARNNRGGGGFPLPLAAGGGRGESGMDGDFDDKEKVAIPGADQYKAPEEFRKDILDAMKQDAPAPFKEHVREYYEEIVK
ncbi:DUF4175 family protein [Vulgatibacter sp.]|uniref:DUF4175 family protein n=1 Tax=Vulgatibacter sp. TaxID=1971226 RepID=UPI003568583A